ncbi:hypothetical protein J4G02_11730 [Candidatus Poribacteria bacterium]|nr:hypothetical protein [Candidatus Poribacteria bacterium]
MNQPVTQTRPIDYIHTVQEALKYRKDDVSYTYLMGASGEAFRFFYNRTDPEAGMNTFFHNPLRATCRALGYSFEVSYDDTYEAASERLQENTRAGKPTLLPFDDSCPFLTRDDGPKTLICQNGSRYQIKTAELHKEWHPSGGFLELGPHGYYQFVIGEREREPKGRDAALGTLRVARKMAETRRKIHGCAIGLAAYDELIAHLSGLLSRIMKWSGQPLTQFIEARTAAADYLQIIREHLEDEEVEHLDDAIAEYQKVVGLLKAVQRLLPSLEEREDAPTDDKTKVRLGLGLSRMHFWMHPNREAQTPEEAMSHFKPKCRAAIKVLQKTVVAETKATRKIRDVLQTSEKTKM